MTTRGTMEVEGGLSPIYFIANQLQHRMIQTLELSSKIMMHNNDDLLFLSMYPQIVRIRIIIIKQSFSLGGGGVH